MCDGTADLDRDYEVHGAYGDLEGLEPDVLIGEDTVFRWVYGVVLDSNTGCDSVICVGAKPSITLSLFEDVVEESVVSVVIHRRSLVGRADEFMKKQYDD